MAIPILQKKPEINERTELLWLNNYNERRLMSIPAAMELNPAGDMLHGDTIEKGYATLVDVAPVDQGNGQKSLSRIFRLTDAGVARKAELAKKFEAN